MNIFNLYIKKILEVLPKKYVNKLFIFIFLFIIATVLETIGIGLIIPVIQAIIDFENFLDHLKKIDLFSNYSLSHETTILLIAGLLLLTFTIKNFFLTLMSYLQYKFLKEVKFYFADRVFDTNLNKNYAYHLNNNSSKIIRDINDTTFATEGVKNLMLLISESLVVVGISIFLFIFQPHGTLISLIIMIFFLVIFLFFFQKKSKIYGEVRFNLEEKKLKFIKDIFGSLKDIKLKDREEFFIERFNNINLSLTSYEMKQNFISSLPRFFLEWVTILVLFSLIFYFTINNIKIEEYFITLGVFAASAFRLMPSFSRIISALQRMKFVSPVLDQFKNNNLEKDINYEKKSVPMPEIRFDKNIIFKNVSFSYLGTDKKILENINFEIKKGQMVGISGPSGSGKSTIVSLITGLLKPDSGKIIIDDNVVLNYSKNTTSWQKKIGYVPQDIFIHDSTLKKNIAFGIHDKKINNKKIKDLLKILRLDEFHQSIDGDISLSLGEYGDKVSGGQKQRIGIARALYENPEILILDESTNALDLKNENEIINDLINFKNMLTIILISHKESTLEKCDKVFHLNNSKILSR